MSLTNFMRAPSTSSSTASLTWRMTIASDWKLILFGAIASFFLASIVMSGGLDGLIPDLSRPYGYAGDGLFHAWMAQRVAEGWLFDNARSGYPFGSNFLDFPGSDGGDHLLIKFFALIGGGWPAGTKLFFLCGFPACFGATYITARAFGLNRYFAFTASMLYTFAPFHFTRLQHLFYTWYFVAPLFFYLALDIYCTQYSAIPAGIRPKLLKLISTALGMLILASFGVYYALFGVIILGTAGAMSVIRWKNPHGGTKAAVLVAATMFGVFINIAPNMINTFKNGPNTEVAQRLPVESEIYGLKMMQLLMPRADHRIESLGNVAQWYNQDTPLVNENATSSFGIIGAAGFMLALLYLMFAPFGTDSGGRLRLLSVVAFVLFLFATIGGLGSLFAMTISPSIRGWNRNSIFIAFCAIFFFFILIQLVLQKATARTTRASAIIAAGLLLIGLYDQTAQPCKVCNASQQASFDSDKEFVHSIEKALPVGGSIYQLPYIAFPEVPPLHRLTNYEMMIGVLHSTALHWSFGGMKGRPGDLFYRALAKEPMERQVEVIRKLGFDGIYVDRRGYPDNGEALIQNLTKILNHPPLLHSDNNELIFFAIDKTSSADFTGLSAKQIQKEAGYFVDGLGPRYSATLNHGIDFTRDGIPDFISDAQGLYAVEPWGRWTSSKALFDFTNPLPQKFTLVFKAQAFGPNALKPTRVEIANHQYNVQIGAGMTEVRIDVDLAGSNASRISFFPPAPVSPKQISLGRDGRVLGIGLISLQIVE